MPSRRDGGQDAQVKPEPLPQFEGVEAPRPPVSTVTCVKRRVTRGDPQAGHARPSPASYAAIDRRRSKARVQSSQVNS